MKKHTSRSRKSNRNGQQIRLSHNYVMGWPWEGRCSSTLPVETDDADSFRLMSKRWRRCKKKLFFKLLHVGLHTMHNPDSFNFPHHLDFFHLQSNFFWWKVENESSRNLWSESKDFSGPLQKYEPSKVHQNQRYPVTSLSWRQKNNTLDHVLN